MLFRSSIEDKVVRFKEKDNHQIFIEPEGWTTNSIYPQGLNTSLPQDVQEQLLYSMKGLADVKILKYGYAVEYDFVFPSQLHPSLETRTIKNLFLAGQINGTSGYEEAAGQGIIAGINAGLRAHGRDPFILKREDSFIGTMIDDLITKNIYEPYRMLTSRSEYRLLLRQDNAIFRLSEKAYEFGLLSNENINIVRKKKDKIDFFIKSWRKSVTTEGLTAEFKLAHKIPLYQFIKRPEVKLSHLLSENLLNVKDRQEAETAMIDVKYEGYIQKQEQDIEKIKKIENNPIPKSVDYDKIPGLKKECREKFKSEQPRTIYEAKKIAGINPADILVLMTFLNKQPAPQKS